MKVYRTILLLALLAGLLAGCTNGEKTYRVKPSGTDDTAAIQAAIDEALADGPGGVIQFAAGDYYLSGPVVARNFSGALRGKGAGESVLHLVPDTPLALWTGSDTAQPGVLFAFEYDTPEPASLTVQDLGLTLIGQAQPYDYEGAQVSAVLPFWVAGVGATRPVSTTFTNVTLRGDPAMASERTYNVESALTLRNVSGTHVVSRSVFETVSKAIMLDNIAGANITIGGATKEDSVTLADMKHGLLSSTGVRNVQLEVAHVDASLDVVDVVVIFDPNASRIHLSDISALGGAALTLRPCAEKATNDGVQVCMQEPSTVLVENSDLLGIAIEDRAASEVVIRNNTFHGVGTYEYGPVWLCGTTGAQITGNTFLGHGPGAINAGMGECAMLAGVGQGDTDTDASITDNDFSQWVQDGGEFEPGWHGQAPIWLGVRTSGVTVSGCGDPKVVVYDETDRINTPEYDGKNIIEGLSTAQSGG